MTGAAGLGVVVEGVVVVDGVVVDGIVPGGAAGFVCGAAGGAAGFWVGVVVPGTGSCPGGLDGSPGGGVGRGVDCGTCAITAVVPPNKISARTAGLIKVRDIELNIRRRAP